MGRISETPLRYRVGAAVAAGAGLAWAIAGCGTGGGEKASQIPKGAIVCPVDTNEFQSHNVLTQRFDCPTDGIIVILNTANDGHPDVSFQQKGTTIPGKELPNGATQGSIAISGTGLNATIRGISEYWYPYPVGNVYSAQTVYLLKPASGNQSSSHVS